MASRSPSRLIFSVSPPRKLANISERRTERLVNPHLSNGLPAFLTRQGGVHSGLMIPQYVAASLVSENKILSHPASVDSITSSASKEDHVSMGAIAARKASAIVKNTRRVIAIELMCAAQAIDLLERRQLGARYGSCLSTDSRTRGNRSRRIDRRHRILRRFSTLLIQVN